MTKDTNMMLWRYMDYEKFKDFIETKSLFFAFPETYNKHIAGEEGREPKDIINQQIDTFLANLLPLYTTSDPNVKIIKNYGDRPFQELLQESLSSPEPCLITEDLNQRAEMERAWYRDKINKTVITCWHINENFNHAMWNKFINKTFSGVAIKISSAGNLTHSLIRGGAVGDLHAGKVRYIDIQNESFNGRDFRNYLFYMNKKFKDEKEFRIIVPLFKTSEEYSCDTWGREDPSKESFLKTKELRKKSTTDGVKIPLDFNWLDFEVYCKNSITEKKIKKLLEANKMPTKILNIGENG